MSDKLYLSDLLKGREEADARKFLRGIYSGIYRAGVYLPRNSRNSWMWVLDKYNIKPKRPLEIGCGAGAGIHAMQKKKIKTWGIDISDNGHIWNAIGVGNRCIQADAAFLPFKSNTFDFVFCPDVMEHIPEFDVDRTIQEMRRVGYDLYYALIAVKLEAQPVNKIMFTHITIKPLEWWKDRFLRAGFKVKTIDRFMDKESDRLLEVGFFMKKNQPKSPWVIQEDTYRIGVVDAQKN